MIREAEKKKCLWDVLEALASAFVSRITLARQHAHFSDHVADPPIEEETQDARNILDMEISFSPQGFGGRH